MSLNQGLISPIGSVSQTQSVTITADPPYYINYNANATDASGVPSESIPAYSGCSYTLSDAVPTRNGYTFLGWSTNSQASTAMYQPGDAVTPSGNLILYAIWSRQSYTLTISSDEHATIHVFRGKDELFDGDTVYYGDTVSINIIVSPGYKIETRTPLEDTLVISDELSISVTTSPMSTIHIRRVGSWAMYLIYKRVSFQWQLYQANIRKNGQWQKYF